MVPFAEPLSPELALVSPELAVAARAALADRPWEAFLPPAGEVVPLRPPAGVPESSVAAAEADAEADAEAVAVGAVSHAPSRQRPRVPIGLVLLAAFIGLVVAGSVLPVRDAPTLGSPLAQAGTTPAPRPRPPIVVPNPASVIAPDRDPAPPLATVPARARVASALRQPAVRMYAMASGKGFLRVDAQRRSIVELHAILPCAGTVTVRDISFAADGAFHVRRHVGLGARLPVAIQGRAIGKRAARGTIRVTGGTCRGVGLGFVARVG